MLNLLIISFFMLLISNIFIMLSFIVSKKTIMDREKCSPFECGLDPKMLPRILNYTFNWIMSWMKSKYI